MHGANHGGAGHGRQGGRCRTKSRSDTTPVHSIITKPRNSHPAICHPSASLPLCPSLSLFTHCCSLQSTYMGMNDTTPWRTNASELTIIPQARPSIPSLPFPFYPSLFLPAVSRSCVLVHRRDYDPSIDPVPGILAASFRPTAPENVKWMFWDRTLPGPKTRFSIPSRPTREDSPDVV